MGTLKLTKKPQLTPWLLLLFWFSHVQEFIYPNYTLFGYKLLSFKFFNTPLCDNFAVMCISRLYYYELYFGILKEALKYHRRMWGWKGWEPMMCWTQPPLHSVPHHSQNAHWGLLWLLRWCSQCLQTYNYKTGFPIVAKCQWTKVFTVFLSVMVAWDKLSLSWIFSEVW